MKRSFLFGAILTPVLCFAQNYNIDWSSIDGGGSTSTGGTYVVSGTIGQSDAGRMSGGNYTVENGFWGIIAAVQTPGAPVLSIVKSGNNMVVSWPSPSSGFSLQENANLGTTNWTVFVGIINDDGAIKKVTISLPTGNRFFRLAQP